jgi:hypothetical protein
MVHTILGQKSFAWDRNSDFTGELEAHRGFSPLPEFAKERLQDFKSTNKIV